MLIYMFRPLPASPEENFPPSSRRSTCPGHRYFKLISGTVLHLLQTLRALSHQKLLLMKRLPRPLCQLFLYPLTIPSSHRLSVTLPHVFRPTNHGGSLAPATPFTLLLWTSHSVWSCASRPAHLG
jgi:hypothetical protein